MRWLRVAQLGVLAFAVADWVVLEKGWLSPHPGLFATLVAILMALLAAGVALQVTGLVSGAKRASQGLGELLVQAGLLVAGGAGTANYLFSLQGFVVLAESERVELAAGRQLQEFEAGPLSDLAEMGMSLELQELDLRPAPGGFVPESRILCRRAGHEPEPRAVRPGTSAACGSLRFHQGAFGFAPRVVILREGGAVFDRVVPFLTRREGAGGVSFEGEFDLESEKLHVRGAVDLGPLDAWMRGHSKLRLEVSRAGKLLGRGELLLGHFAELDEGYRIGFAGLEQWSEIDVSRRNYGRFVLAGAGLALAGAVWWPIARWRSR